MKEQLEETYGVMVFQEDVIKVCHHFAGLDLADADVLRRAMSESSVRRVEFQRIMTVFRKTATHWVARRDAREVWAADRDFCRYSFSKAHSAHRCGSFKSLYLKPTTARNYGFRYQQFWWIFIARLCGTNAAVWWPY